MVTGFLVLGSFFSGDGTFLCVLTVSCIKGKNRPGREGCDFASFFFVLVRILMRGSILEMFGEKNGVCGRRTMRWKGVGVD